MMPGAEVVLAGVKTPATRVEVLLTGVESTVPCWLEVDLEGVENPWVEVGLESPQCLCTGTPHQKELVG